MTIPKLTHKFSLQSRTATGDGSGGIVETWSTLGDLWGGFGRSGGRRVAGEETALSRSRHVVTVRAAPPGSPSRPAPGHRLVAGTMALRVISVSERDSAAMFLDCIVEEEIAI